MWKLEFNFPLAVSECYTFKLGWAVGSIKHTSNFSGLTLAFFLWYLGLLHSEIKLILGFILESPGFDFPAYSFYEVGQVTVSLRLIFFFCFSNISPNLSESVVMPRVDNFMYHGNFVDKINEMSKRRPL